MNNDDFEDADQDLTIDKFEGTPPAAVDLLPEIALRRALGQEGIARIEGEGSLCVIVRVPESTWVVPITRALRGMGEFAHRIAAREKPRSKSDEVSTLVARHLSEGDRVFGVAPDPEAMLPPVLLAAADLRVDLGKIDGSLVAELIKTITGQDVEVDDRVAGLSFDQIVISIRSGSTGEECLNRLAAAATRMRFSADGIDGAVPVENLIGYGEAGTWAVDLVRDIDAWRVGKADFETIEARMVLAGPPGTGKTTFAKSVARSAGIPLFATSAAAWFLTGSGYLDGVIKQMDAVFAAARAQAPAMIFIDELDAVPDRRTLSTRGRDWWTPVIGHLLTLLDGANAANKDLVIVGATNYPDRLDDALIRPGRLSRLICIEPPTQHELTLILRQHLRDALPDADLQPIAAMMGGATGAVVAETVKRARASARRAGRELVEGDLLAIVAPPDDRAPSVVERIAIHEAGHAVTAHVLGSAKVTAISMVGIGGIGGMALFDRDGTVPTRQDVEHRVMQLLGGRAAEKVLIGDIGTGSGGLAESDLARATMFVGSLHANLGLGRNLRFQGPGESLGTLLQVDGGLAAAVEAELRDLHGRTEALIADNIGLVRAVADALRKSRYLTGEDFLRIVQGGAPNAD